MCGSDAQVIHAMYRSMYRFIIDRDVERLGALLDGFFVLVHMTGRHQGKDEFLRCVADGTLAYYDEVEESCRVQARGDRAKLVGRSLVEASPFGAERSTWRLQQEIDLAKCDGTWRMTRAVASMY